MGSVCLLAVTLAFTVLGASISTVASEWPSQHICRAPVLYLSVGSLPVLLFPCPAVCCWQKLARKVLVWILLHCGDLCGLLSAPWAHPLSRGACVHLSQLPRHTLCTCFGSRGLPFASWGWCALVSAPQAGLCIAGIMRICFLSPPASHCIFISKQFSKKEEERHSWAFFLFYPVK